MEKKPKTLRGPAAPQSLEAAQNPAALLKIDTVRQLTGLGVTSIYKKCKDGTFPAPHKLGKRCTRWPSAAIHAWLEAPQ